MLRLTLGARTLPFAIIISYLLFTVSLFYLGPVPWPVSNPGALGIFLTAVIVGIAAFGRLGSSGAAAGSPIEYWKVIIIAGALLSFVLLFPSAYFYADKMPWQLFEAMRDQGATYEGLKSKLATSGDRTLISLVRAVTYPVIFAALPLAILNWRRMAWWLWLLVGLALFSSVAFSILRGTDREIFDIIVIGAAAFMVVIIRQSIPLRRLVIPAVCALVIVAVAIVAFADRRMQRASVQRIGTQASSLTEYVKTPEGWFDLMCIKDRFCLDPDHALVRHVDAPIKYTVLMLTSYLTQGYYGLSLAMTENFHSTFGIGHSPAITRLYERLSGNTLIYERSYTYGLRKLGWSDESQWSTIFTSLANDVDFPGAIAVICVLAFLLGRSWRDAIGSSNDAAAIVFCLLFQLFVYAPANNQLAQTFDGYFAVIGWCSIWLFKTRWRAAMATAPR